MKKRGNKWKTENENFRIKEKSNHKFDGSSLAINVLHNYTITGSNKSDQLPIIYRQLDVWLIIELIKLWERKNTSRAISAIRTYQPSSPGNLWTLFPDNRFIYSFYRLLIRVGMRLVLFRQLLELVEWTTNLIRNTLE